MFDINEYLSAPCVDVSFVVARGTEEFRLRRLNGAERLKFNDLTTRFDRILFALARGALTPEGRPIGEEAAGKLLARSGALGEALFEDIFDATQQGLDAEREIWRDVKKKSPSEGSTTARD